MTSSRFAVDLEINTSRQRKALERHPVLFLANKLNGAEVNIHRLNDYEKSLFEKAKTKKVTSSLKNEAVHKCPNDHG